MQSFRYKAVSAAGEIIEGTTQAQGQAAVIDWLQGLGHFPLRAEPVKDGGGKGLFALDLLGGGRISKKYIGVMTRELAMLLNAGLPLERAFTILIELTPEPVARSMLNRVLDGIRGGTPLADALAQENRTFPPYYVSLVRAGEAGGALEAVLSRLADYLEKAQALAESVRSALIYPAILLVMTAASIVVLMTVVVPEFKSLFDDAGDTLPFATQIMIGISEAVARTWWMIAILALSAFWLLRRRLADPAFRLRWDRLVLALPLFGNLVRNLQVARFSRTLGTLLHNGVSLLGALSIVRDSLGNAALMRAVDDVAARLREGKGLAQPLAETAIFPDLAVQLIRVGEETGELPAMLTKLADIYDREVQLTIDRLVALLVPALTIGLGAIIAAIIGSVVLAFLSVNELAL